LQVGLEPDVICLTAAMQALVAASELDQAFDVLQQVLAHA
jgi:hypothetical protein